LISRGRRPVAEGIDDGAFIGRRSVHSMPMIPPAHLMADLIVAQIVGGARDCL
jgi:hypothetical protein